MASSPTGWRVSARCCARKGIRREERILICLLDTIDWPTAFLGALKAGVVPVPVNTLMTESDYEFMLADSRAQDAGGVGGAAIRNSPKLVAQVAGPEACRRVGRRMRTVTTASRT